MDIVLLQKNLMRILLIYMGKRNWQLMSIVNQLELKCLKLYFKKNNYKNIFLIEINVIFIILYKKIIMNNLNYIIYKLINIQNKSICNNLQKQIKKC